jgi:hypothetical protein
MPGGAGAIGRGLETVRGTWREDDARVWESRGSSKGAGVGRRVIRVARMSSIRVSRALISES